MEELGIPKGWLRLGDPPPDSLVEDRLQLHHAAQILTSFSQAYLEPRDDDSHRSMTWDLSTRSFLTGTGPAGLVLALTPATLELELRVDDRPVARTGLRSRTLADGYAWLRQRVETHGGGTEPLEPPDFEIPDHPVGDGAPFSGSAPGLAELARWYHDAALILDALGEEEERLGEVRCWPHHFDIAALVVVEEADDPGDMRTVGVGMTPGDDGYPQPYLYVKPWPRADADDLRPLPGPGGWHTSHWVGAVLTGTELVDAGDGAAQAGRAVAFLGDAVPAALAWVEGGG